MLPIVTFSGPHNSGKTTLVRGIVSILKSRGYKVGVVKSTKHEDLFPEPSQKDTALYRKDGVEHVVLIEPKRAVHFWEKGPSVSEVAISLLSKVDIVVGEGFKNSSLPKIEVVPEGESISQTELKKRENLLAVVCRESIPGVKTFSPEDTSELASFIEGLFLAQPWVTLCVNGKEVPMKPFVEKTVATTVAALVGNLRGGEGAEKIELTIRLPNHSNC